MDFAKIKKLTDGLNMLADLKEVQVACKSVGDSDTQSDRDFIRKVVFAHIATTKLIHTVLIAGLDNSPPWANSGEKENDA